MNAYSELGQYFVVQFGIIKYQVSSINFISIKHYIKIHQDKKKTYMQQNHMEE